MYGLTIVFDKYELPDRIQDLLIENEIVERRGLNYYHPNSFYKEVKNFWDSYTGGGDDGYSSLDSEYMQGIKEVDEYFNSVVPLEIRNQEDYFILIHC